MLGVKKKKDMIPLGTGLGFLFFWRAGLLVYYLADGVANG